jgi:hypothetical protein
MGPFVAFFGSTNSTWPKTNYTNDPFTEFVRRQQGNMKYMK